MSFLEEMQLKLGLDASDLESGATEAGNILDKLKDKLSFSELESSVSSFEKILSKLDFLGVSQNAEKATSDISNAFEECWSEIVTGFEREIGTKLANKFSALVESLTVAPVASGWEKYEETVYSVQKILTNTDFTIEEVEAQIEKLAWYSDATSYGLTDMTGALSTFIASGNDMYESVDAIMGISNWAASAGVNAQTASGAYAMLSKAMDQHYMSLRYWNSLQNVYHMGTTQFLDKVLELGVAQKKLNTYVEDGTTYYQAWNAEKDDWSDAYTSMSALFTETLSTKWFDDELMNSVFSAFGEASTAVYETYGAVTDVAGALEELGYESDDFATKMFLAAQQAKTWTDTLEAWKDVVSTAWNHIFEAVFGNYEEAAEFWTFFCDEVGAFFWDLPSLLAEAAEGWHDMETAVKGVTKYDQWMASIEHIVSAFGNIRVAISQGVFGDDIFDNGWDDAVEALMHTFGKLATKIWEASVAFEEWTDGDGFGFFEELAATAKDLIGIFKTLAPLMALRLPGPLKLISALMLDGSTIIEKFANNSSTLGDALEYVRGVIDATQQYYEKLIGVGKDVLDLVLEFIEACFQTNDDGESVFTKLCETVEDLIEMVTDVLGIIVELGAAFLGIDIDFDAGGIENLDDIAEKISNFCDKITSLPTLREVISNWIEEKNLFGVSDALDELKEKVSSFTGSKAFTSNVLDGSYRNVVARYFGTADDIKSVSSAISDNLGVSWEQVYEQVSRDMSVNDSGYAQVLWTKLTQYAEAHDIDAQNGENLWGILLENFTGTHYDELAYLGEDAFKDFYAGWESLSVTDKYDIFSAVLEDTDTSSLMYGVARSFVDDFDNEMSSKYSRAMEQAVTRGLIDSSTILEWKENWSQWTGTEINTLEDLYNVFNDDTKLYAWQWLAENLPDMFMDENQAQAMEDLNEEILEQTDGWDILVEKIKGMKDEIPKLTDLWQDLAEGIKDATNGDVDLTSWSGFSSTIQNLGGYLKTAAGNLQTFVESFFGIEGDTVEEKAYSWGQAIGNIAEAIGKFLGVAWDQLKSTAGVAKEAWDVFITFIQGLLDSLGFGDAADAVGTLKFGEGFTLVGVIEDITDLVEQIGSAITVLLTSIAANAGYGDDTTLAQNQAAADKLNFGANILNGIGEVIGTMMKIVTNIVDFISESGQGLIDLIKGNNVNFASFGDVTSTIGDVFDDLSGLVERIVSAAKNFMGGGLDESTASEINQNIEGYASVMSSMCSEGGALSLLASSGTGTDYSGVGTASDSQLSMLEYLSSVVIPNIHDSAQTLMGLGLAGIQGLIDGTLPIVTAIVETLAENIGRMWHALVDNDVVSAATTIAFSWKLWQLITSVQSAITAVSKVANWGSQLTTSLTNASNAFKKWASAQKLNALSSMIKNVVISAIAIMAALYLFAYADQYFDESTVDRVASYFVIFLGALALMFWVFTLLYEKITAIKDKSTLAKAQAVGLANTVGTATNTIASALKTTAEEFAKAIKWKAIGNTILKFVIAVLAISAAIIGAAWLLKENPELIPYMKKAALLIGGVAAAIIVVMLALALTSKLFGANKWSVAGFATMAIMLTAAVTAILLISGAVLGMVAVVMVLKSVADKLGVDFEACLLESAAIMLGVIFVLIAVMIVLVGISQDMASNPTGYKNIIALAASILLITAALVLIAGAVVGLAALIDLFNIDTGAIWTVVGVIGVMALIIAAFMAVIVGLVYVCGKAEGGVTSVAVDSVKRMLTLAGIALLALMAALVVLIICAKSMKSSDVNKVKKLRNVLISLAVIIAGIMVVVVLIAKLCKMDQKTLIECAVLVGIAVLAVLAMVLAIKMLAEINTSDLDLDQLVKVMDQMAIVMAVIIALIALVAVVNYIIPGSGIGMALGGFVVVCIGLATALIGLGTRAFAQAIEILSNLDADNLSNVFQAIGDGVKILIDLIGAAIIYALPKIAEGLGGALGTLASSLGTGFGKLKTSLSSSDGVISKFVNLFKKILIGVFVIGVVLAAISLVTGKDFDELLADFAEMFAKFLTYVPDMFEDMTEIVFGCIDSFLTALDSRLPSILDHVQGILDTICQRIPQMLASAIGNLWVGIASPLGGLGGAISDFLSAVANGNVGDFNWGESYNKWSLYSEYLYEGCTEEEALAKATYEASEACKTQSAEMERDAKAAATAGKTLNETTEATDEYAESAEEAEASASSFYEGVREQAEESKDTFMTKLGDTLSEQTGVDITSYLTGDKSFVEDLVSYISDGAGEVYTKLSEDEQVQAIMSIFSGENFTLGDGTTIDWSEYLNLDTDSLSFTNGSGESIDYTSAINLVSSGETVYGSDGTQYSDLTSLLMDSFTLDDTVDVDTEAEVETQVYCLVDTANLPEQVATMLESVGEFANAGEVLGTALVTAFHTTMTYMKNFAKNSCNATKIAIRTYRTQFNTAGRYLAEGAVIGFKTAIASLVTYARQAGYDSISAFKQAVQNGSPSKLMYKEGYWEGEGAVNGFQAAANVLVAAAYDAGADSITAFNEGTSSVTPVVDLSNLELATGQIKAAFADTTALNAEYTANLRGKAYDTKDVMYKGFEDLVEKMEDVVNASNYGFENLGRSVEGMSNMGIYLDSGAMVGNMAPDMDMALAKNYRKRGRL